VVVADINKEAVEALAHQMNCQPTTNWEEIVTRPDVAAIIVATPPHLHASISIAAMKGGKHVLCEKPLASTVEEAEEMVRVAQEQGVILKCGFNLRHHPGIQQAKRWVGESRIGEIIFIRCRYGIGGRPHYEKEWRAQAEISGGGELMDQGVHALDLCCWFLPDLREGFAFLSTAFWDIAPLEDNAFVLLRSAEGRVASIHVSWTQWKPLFSFEVFGSKGYVLVEGLGGVYGTTMAILGHRKWGGPFAEEVLEFRGADLSWQAEWREFLTAIREEREPLGSGRDGLHALRLVQRLYEAASTGEKVTLPGDQA
jgi:predicted dehydrogenase